MIFEDSPDHIATPQEACQEFARNFGQQHQNWAWVLTDFDTWERNPYYQGPPQPHPEDDYQHLDERITPEPLAEAIAKAAHEYSVANHEVEDCPF